MNIIIILHNKINYLNNKNGEKYYKYDKFCNKNN